MNENKRFETLKNEILHRAHENGACKEQYGRAYKSENFAELMEVLRDNFDWACNNKVLDAEIIEKYKEDFAEGKIYANTDISEGFLLASGNATVRAWDNATVRALDNATVRASGNATVVASGNATVVAWDNATVRAWGNAYITSYATIECKLSDNAIHRIRKTNTIRYASDGLKFEKV